MKDLKCPYCNYEFDVCDFEDEEEFDIECPECEKEFQVNVDWTPSFEESKIEYYDCLVCGENKRSQNIQSRIPWPKTLEGKDCDKICDNCYHNEIIKELSETK